jgi:hypothetical protein
MYQNANNGPKMAKQILQKPYKNPLNHLQQLDNLLQPSQPNSNAKNR